MCNVALFYIKIPNRLVRRVLASACLGLSDARLWVDGRKWGPTGSRVPVKGVRLSIVAQPELVWCVGTFYSPLRCGLTQGGQDNST